MRNNFVKKLSTIIKYFLFIIIIFTYPTLTNSDKILNNRHLQEVGRTLYQDNSFSTIISSFSIIFFSEFGDRTFFVIMIYSLTNEPIKTFLNSAPTLLILNFAAISFGCALPIFVYRRMLEWMACFVFAILSFILLYDGLILDYHSMKNDFVKTYRKYSKHEDTKENEYTNLRSGLLQDEESQANITLRDLNQEPPAFDTTWSFVTSLILSECGDKSQISGILIGALNDFYPVLIGTSFAFLVNIIISICIGYYISGKISKKSIMIITGMVYLIFAISYLLQIFYVI